MKIERGYAEYSDKAIKREAVKQEKPSAEGTYQVSAETIADKMLQQDDKQVD